MFKRIKPLFIRGRLISDPLAVELAQFLTDERALFVAELRRDREYTFRDIATTCAEAWGKPWRSDQIIGAALCELAAAHMGEDPSYLDG